MKVELIRDRDINESPLPSIKIVALALLMTLVVTNVDITGSQKPAQISEPSGA